MPRKSIFCQPGTQHFQLVHRSQRDPPIHALTRVCKYVLKPWSETTRKDACWLAGRESSAKPLERNNKPEGLKKASNQRVGDRRLCRPGSTVMQLPFELLNSTEGGAGRLTDIQRSSKKKKERKKERNNTKGNSRADLEDPNTPSNLRHSRPGCTKTCPPHRREFTNLLKPGPIACPRSHPKAPPEEGCPSPSHRRSTAGQKKKTVYPSAEL
ncbi:hypothetical protein C8R47DRAFT_530909 [Mycena vitilis]|nr:hypothetical protein C8R47DRAFT_530909 [Mycena vitilis]